MSHPNARWGEMDQPWWRSWQTQTTKEDTTMVAGQDMQPGELDGNGRYRGVPVPGLVGQQGMGQYGQGWKDGIDAVLTRAGDTDTSGDRTVSPEVSAFEAVTNEDKGAARDIVSRMSGRDRAVLSFWLGELGDIVSALETDRRWT